MAQGMFGELFKELRQKRGLTLREYCRTYGKDPGNMSRLERGKLQPPIKNEDIKDLALSVGLQENTEEWENFFSVAKISAGRIPDDIMSDEEVLQHLPLFLRTISGQKLSDNKLKELIDIIKTG